MFGLRSDAKCLMFLRLGGLQVLGVEVLWTPQAEGDTFSKDDVEKDYPDLRLL